MFFALLASLASAGSNPLDGLRQVAEPLERGLARHLDGYDPAKNKKLRPFGLEPTDEKQLGRIQVATHEVGKRVLHLSEIKFDVFLFKGEERIQLTITAVPDGDEAMAVKRLDSRVVHNMSLGFKPLAPERWGPQFADVARAVAKQVRIECSSDDWVGSDPINKKNLQKVCNDVAHVRSEEVALRVQTGALVLDEADGTPHGRLNVRFKASDAGPVVGIVGYIPEF